MNLEKYAKPSEMDIEDIMDFISDVQNDHEGLITDDIKLAVIKEWPRVIHKIKPDDQLILEALRLGIAEAFGSAHFDYKAIPDEEYMNHILSLDDDERTVCYPDYYIDRCLKSADLSKESIEAIIRKFPCTIELDGMERYKTDDLQLLALDSYMEHRKKRELGYSICGFLGNKSVRIWEAVYEKLGAEEVLDAEEPIPPSIRERIILDSPEVFTMILDSRETKLWLDTWYQTKKASPQQIKDALKASRDYKESLHENPQLIGYLTEPENSDYFDVIKSSPNNIKYIKNPPAWLVRIAFAMDASVIKDIHNPTLEMYEMAGIKPPASKKFPKRYYYVTMRENIVGEGEIIYAKAVKGSEMELFLKQECRCLFGNLDNYEYFKVGDRASYQPITKAEMEILEKFGVLEQETGEWHFR